MNLINAKAKSLIWRSTGSAVSFIILLGFVSLFADMTYEGARSLNGQFLSFLGASGTAVGMAAGAGEFLGYALRFVSGYISDRTRRYWTMTFVGYAINLLAVPALALVGRWEWAVGLIFAERIGKAIRNPARDAMLSHAVTTTGAGWGFGLHEALDQIGAVLGPLMIAAVFFFQDSGQPGLETYQNSYALLLIPALLALLVLIIARWRFPNPSNLSSKSPQLGATGFRRSYWWYLGGAGLIAAGFADFPLIAFHFERVALAPVPWIPLFYALAMAIDAVAALVLGHFYDKKGLPLLIGVSAVAALFAPLVFLGNLSLAVVGLALWGVGMGMQESVMRAVVANLAPPDKRGTAYGLFHTGFGLCWFLGSVLLGFLYDQALLYLVIFSVVSQLTAIPLLILASRGIAAEGDRLP